MNLRLICAFWTATGFLCAQTGVKKLAEADCTAERLGASIPVERDRRAGCGSDFERSGLETRSGAAACVLQHRRLDGAY